MSPAATAEPLLDLTTLDPIDRPFITIDGERHELAVASDFGILAYGRLDNLVTRLEAIRDTATGDDADPLTQGQIDELDRILKVGVEMVLRAPKRVLAKLTDTQRLMVIQAFTTASRRTARKTNPNRAARRRTGVRSSQSSAASTATTPG